MLARPAPLTQQPFVSLILQRHPSDEITMALIECPKCEAKFSQPTLVCPECGEKFSEPTRGSGKPQASAEMPKSVLRVAKKAADLLVALDDKCFPREKQPAQHPGEAKDSATTRDLETVRWLTIVAALGAGLVPLTFFFEPPYTHGFLGHLASFICRALSGVVVGCFVAAAISHFHAPLLSWGPRRWWHVALFTETGWGLLTGTFVSSVGFAALPLILLALASDHPTVQALEASISAKLRHWVKKRRQEPKAPVAGIEQHEGAEREPARENDELPPKVPLLHGTKRQQWIVGTLLVIVPYAWIIVQHLEALEGLIDSNVYPISAAIWIVGAVLSSMFVRSFAKLRVSFTTLRSCWVFWGLFINFEMLLLESLGKLMFTGLDDPAKFADAIKNLPIQFGLVWSAAMLLSAFGAGRLVWRRPMGDVWKAVSIWMSLMLIWFLIVNPLLYHFLWTRTLGMA